VFVRCTALAVGIGGFVFNVARRCFRVVARKGGGGVAEIPDELEIERLRNLVQGFGWVVVKTETKTDRIVLNLELERELKETPESPGPG